MLDSFDQEHIKHLPTDALVTELKRRMEEFFAVCQQAVGSWVMHPHPDEAEETLPDPTGAIDLMLPEEEGEPPAPATPTWTTPYTKAQEAGLGVPNRDPNRPLPAHLQVARELPKLMDPARKAAMWEGVDRDMRNGHAEALAEAEAKGDTATADYLRELPTLLASRDLAAPSLAAIVAINKRNAQDAFIQPILPPSLKGAVQAPTETKIEWFDNPAVVTIPLRDIVVNTAPLRPGIPATPEYELEARTKDLAKLITNLIGPMTKDGFTGHLPCPVVKVLNDYAPKLQLLLEPVVIWRLLTHLGPRLPYTHYVANLCTALNAHIEAEVSPEWRVLVRGNAETMAPDFRDRVTALLAAYYQSELLAPVLKQATKRQIRILNAEFQERGIPSAPDADRAGIRDPRELWGQGLPARISLRQPSPEAQLTPLPTPIAPDADR